MSRPPTIAVKPAHLLTGAEMAAWSALQEADETLRSPFFRPEFTAAVAAVRSNVYVGVIHHGDELVGFFPFQRNEEGMGEPVGGMFSDYQGVISEANLSLDAGNLIRCCGLAEWRFDHLLAGQSSFRFFQKVLTESPAIDLSLGYENYVMERREAGSEQIKKAMNLRRRLEREIGSLRFERHSPDSSMLRQLLRWKSDQYVDSGKADKFSEPWVIQFVERVHCAQGAEFAGMLSLLRAGDRVIAAHLGMRSATEWHYWIPAYDPAYAKYSPGIILLLEMAQAAPALGIRWIDLGKGRADYKTRLANHATRLAEGVVPASRLACATTAVRWAGLACLRRAWMTKPVKRLVNLLR